MDSGLTAEEHRGVDVGGPDGADRRLLRGACRRGPTVTTSPTDQFATLRTRTVRWPALAATVVVVLPNGFAPTVQLRLSPHVFPIGSARISSFRPAAGSAPPRKRTVSVRSLQSWSSDWRPPIHCAPFQSGSPRSSPVSQDAGRLHRETLPSGPHTRTRQK